MADDEGLPVGVLVDNPQDANSASSDSSDSPEISRSSSFNSVDWFSEEVEFALPDNFPIFDPFGAIYRLERVNQSLNLRKHRDRLKEHYAVQKERVIKKRNEELEKYRRKYGKALDKLVEKWSDSRAVTLREKISFVVGVSNIFITGYLVGGHPDWVHIWYSLQLVYFMPIRYYSYHKRGYHYFLADLCYFVNMLLLLSIWVFPNSTRLFISTYCLAYGNNAWAVAMWRNSLVFHSLDKVTSLFIHIMPPLVLHCLVHLLEPSYLEAHFPAIYRIKTIEQYDMRHLMLWATFPYMVWQISYHFFITVRRADQIARGRPTSFTWLRKSYSKTWIGKFVLSLPENLQEFAFMVIQYSYALLTMLPGKIWLYSRLASGIFLTAVALWSVYNGANYYIDVFGNRFKKELEELKKEVAKWQNSPTTPNQGPINDPWSLTLNGSVIASGETATGTDTTTTATTSVTGIERVGATGGVEENKLRERNVTTNMTMTMATSTTECGKEE